MKYLKIFENKNKLKFGKDYSDKYSFFKNSEYKYINRDIEELKSRNIKYTLYYYIDFNFGLLFKIYINDYISDEDSKFLKKYLNFMLLMGDYEFTWDWIKVHEDDVDMIISSNKYNL